MSRTVYWVDEREWQAALHAKNADQNAPATDATAPGLSRSSRNLNLLRATFDCGTQRLRSLFTTP